MRITDKNLQDKEKRDFYVNKSEERMLVCRRVTALIWGRALKQVKADAQKITDALNESGLLPYPIILQELAVNADQITQLMKEVNYRDEVIGVMTWMHTFSPAKMWIRGTSLCKSLFCISSRNTMKTFRGTRLI